LARILSLKKEGRTMADSAGAAAVQVPARRPSLIWPIGVAIGQGAAWFWLVVFVMVMEPSYERIFRDFKMPLPIMTQWFIDLGHFLFDYWYLLTVPLLAWTIFYGAVVWQLERRQSAVGKLLWYGLTWFAPLLFLISANLAFMIPMRQLLNILRGSP
jgi:type II secretory pathway component PulF